MSGKASRPGPPHNGRIWMHPVSIGLGLAAFVAIVTLNVLALVLGQRAPWLVAGVLVCDLLLIGTGIALVLRERMNAQVQSDRVEQVTSESRAAVAHSEARLAAIVDSAMDAIVSVDQDQRIILFNRAAEQVFGCRREEAIGGTLDRFIPSRFREAHHRHIERFGRTGVTSRQMGDVTTLWALRASGEEFPIEAAISQVAQDDRHYYTVILRDVTLRRRYEDELKNKQAELRELSAAVQDAREEEKTRIARELHDELGQLLTALKMDIGWLRERLPSGDPALSAKVQRMTDTLNETVTSVRRIAADLRPLMLDDLGLSDAVSWLVEDFSQRSGVKCEMRAPEPEALNVVERGVANTVYRALQESLTNIARHAEASNAWILLALEDGVVRLEIEDNGRGISKDDLAKSRSLGLKGMRERVLHLGGDLEVMRAPRGGTRIALRLPKAQGRP